MTDNKEAKLYELFEWHNKNTEHPILEREIKELIEGIKEITKVTSYHEKVREFHETFSQVIGHSPSFPSREVIILRLSLILEELSELAEACGPEVCTDFQIMMFRKSQEIHYKIQEKRENMIASLVEVIDALTDLQYVLAGTVVSFGMNSIVDEAFDIVHDSNMSKACMTFVEAEETKHLYDLADTETISVPKTINNKEVHLVFRKHDNKVLKSINYKPANLSKLIFNGL